MSLRIVSLLFLVFGATAAHAARTPDAISVQPAEFRAMRADIEAEIRASAAFREMDLNERKEVARALDRMQEVLAEIDDVDQLDPPTRTQLFNDQELVNHVLTKAQSDDQVVCQRTRRVGSKMYTNTCMTVGERRRSQESVETEMQRLPRNWPKEIE